MPEPHRNGGTIADGHVHLYDCFELQEFLTGASRNLRKATERLASAPDSSLVLMLTETRRESAFDRLMALQEEAGESNHRWWTERIPDDDCALIARHPTERELIIIAGRQVVSEERLEVLALATRQPIPDGMSLPSLTRSILKLGAIPVLPWGVGKWLGKRGRIVADFVRSDAAKDVFLGDISGRPFFWPRSSVFDEASSRGIRLLPGTDPLPLKSETARAGTCGFHIDRRLPRDRPTEALKDMLVYNSAEVTPFLNRESAWRFLRNQTAIRVP